VDNVRFFLLGDEVACSVFGQAGIHLGQYFGVLALGVELLQLRAQASALGRGGLVLTDSAFRDLGSGGAVCVLPCSQLPVGFRAR
jgi:hypothetical protein